MDRLLRRPRFASVLLVGLTAVVYAGAFRGVFHYDDAITILLNPHLDGWHVFVNHLDHMVRPLLYLTFLTDRTLYGDSPAGYHVLNVALHLACGLLVYRILTQAGPQPGHVAFWTACLFLIHPIQTEAVTYLSGRASVLMAFCYLLALALYIAGTAKPEAGVAHRALLFAAGLMCVAALASKETAATFPLTLLMWDGLVRGLRGPILRRSLLYHHGPFWGIVLTAAVWAWVHPRYAELAEFSWTVRPLFENALSELHAGLYGALLFLCPWQQNFDHDLPVVRSVFQWPAPLEILILAALVTFSATTARRLPLVSFGIAWYVVHIVPMAFIPRVDLLSERNLYLPSVGLLLALVSLAALAGGRLLAPRSPRLAALPSAVGIVLVVVLCIMTTERNALYADPLLLWSDTVRKSPQKARPHNNLGYAYAVHDDWDRAIDEFRTAARLDPDYVLARKNLRDAYLRHIGRP